MKKKCEYCGKYNCICKDVENHSEYHKHDEEKNHVHNNKKKKNRLELLIYIVAVILFILSFFFIKPKYHIITYLVVILLSGYVILIEGIKNLIKLNFEESTLMTIATIAAFALGEYPEACLVILLFRLGEFLEDKIVDRSQKNIEDIVKIKVDNANVINNNGEIEIKKSEDVQIGDIILVKPGEKVPLDGIVIHGNSEIDKSAITGESTSVSVGENDIILSGSVNISGVIKIKVEKDYKNSTISQITDLVYEATNNKGKTEKFITRFSKIYTPVVLILALIIAIVVPVFTGFKFEEWMIRSLIFLVASCPCSIVISIPLAMFSGVGSISKKGLLLKGTKYVEKLSKATVVAFDKTGTLTTGKMILDRVDTVGNYDKETIMKYIVNLENLSNHPISKAFSKEKVEILEHEDYEEIAGHGIYCKLEGKEVVLGNKKILEKYEVDTKNIRHASLYLAIDKKVEGYAYIKEEVNEGSIRIIKELKKEKINRVVMLTGDNEIAAKKIADELNIKEFYSELLPIDKKNIIEKIKKENEKIVFVGDGINDAPVLATADLGISMEHGTHIANSISDGILMTNKLNVLPKSLHIARKTINICKFNIIFSLLIKLIVIILGFIGIAPIWSAVLADTGVTFLTVMNSIRIIKGE